MHANHLGRTACILWLLTCGSAVYVEDMTHISTFGNETAYSTGSQTSVVYDLETYGSSNALGYAYLNTELFVDELKLTEMGSRLLIKEGYELSGNTSLSATLPNLWIEKTVEVYNRDHNPEIVKVSLYITNNSTVSSNTVFNITVEEGLSPGMRVNYGTVNEEPNSQIVMTGAGESGFEWDVGDLPSKSFMVSNIGLDVKIIFTCPSGGNGSYLEYNAKPAGEDGTDLPEGTRLYSSNVYLSIANSVVLGPLTLDICIQRVNNYKESLVYQHGFTALSFFLAFLLGFVAVVVGVLIFFYLGRRKTLPSGINQKSKSGKSDHVLLKGRGNQIMMDANAAMSNVGHTITDYSSVDGDDTIIGILTEKDRLKRHREIDSLDIVNTIKIDTDIEQQRDDAAMRSTDMLIQGLVHNKDITPSTADAATNHVRKRKMALNNALDDEYKRHMKKLYKKLSAKNRAKMTRMVHRHREKKKKLASEIADLGDKEREQLLNLIDQQHQTELDEETYRLKLEQDEETENLRKEFAVRKRMGMKEIQQESLDLVAQEGRLNQEKYDWLMKEHRDSQNKLEKLYDEEIAKQRLILEEKLEKRRALAKLKEKEEDDNSDLLNTLASHQIEVITKAKSKKFGSAISSSEAETLIEEAKQNMLTLRDKLDKDRQRQEAELQKRLGEMKKKQLRALRNEQKVEMDKLEKDMQTQTDGPMDPVAFADAKLKLQSQQRDELNKVENEIDEEHAEKLKDLNETLLDTAKEQLVTGERTLIEKLNTQFGAPVDNFSQIIKQHEKEVSMTEDQQNREQEMMKRHLKEKLEKRKEEWNKRREQEKLEQQQLRAREEQVVNKLISSQMSMSEEERDRILKEHEKQMVKLENSLTLSKLKQKRMLEEKLAQKRMQQMNKLQQIQSMEFEKKRMQIEHNAEESDEESQREKLALLKRQFEQKMAIIHGQKLDIDDELENVKIEMMKDRALSLKDQEERLGAMVATLQLTKAREVAKIEDQQKAINNLKLNLMDDLNERGILSDPECQAVLRRHKEAQDDLKKKLEQQKLKQEKELKRRLREKRDQMEVMMEQSHQREIEELLNKTKSKTARKIKKVLLIHKHMLAMEQFENRLQREIAQTLEEVTRSFEVKKMKAMQKQELEFIAGLVKVGAFKQGELVDVLHLLFPAKTEREIQELLNEILDPTQQPTKNADVDESHTHSLLNKVRGSQVIERSSRRGSSLSVGEDSIERTPKRNSLRKKRPSSASNEFSGYPHPQEESYTYLDARPEPIGEVVEAQHIDDFAPRERARKLPPLPTTQEEKPVKKKRKKKKVLKKLAQKEDEDIDYGYDDSYTF